MQQATAPTQDPAGPVVYVRVDQKLQNVTSDSFAKKSAKGLSIAQISLGSATMLCQFLIIIISTTYTQKYRENICGMGEGMYCGFFYVIAGILGLSATRKPSRCNITAFMILSIIAAVFSGIHILISSINLMGNTRYNGYNEPIGRRYNQVLFVAMILSALAEGVISVICATLCCRAYCCCCSRPEVYLTQGPGPVEEGPAQVPVQLGLNPVPVIQTFNQKINQPPSYAEVGGVGR